MISKFSGKYRFLSNFYPCCVPVGGVVYPSVEHYFQISKLDELPPKAELDKLLSMSASDIKRWGRSIILREGWGDDKIRVMFEGVLAKFIRNGLLRIALLATGEEELIEGNTWNDYYWGVCRGVGQNNLGLILMYVRNLLRA